MSDQGVVIEHFDGDRNDIRWLFGMAEDSDQRLDRSIDRGQVWVALTNGGDIVGHVQAVTSADGSTWEVLNTAVDERLQGSGIGRMLLQRAVDEARRAGATRVELATATADIGNLRFYQRCGFRMSRVVRDAFGPHSGYPHAIEIDGVPLRDQVWFDLTLSPLRDWRCRQ